MSLGSSFNYIKVYKGNNDLLIIMRFDLLVEKLREAQEESNCRVPMAAMVVRGGRPIAIGNNKKGYRGCSLHAEVDALRQLRYQKRRGRGCTVVVARFRADGSYGLAKPCANCIEFMKSEGVNDVAWTTARGTIEIQSLREIENKYIPPTTLREDN
jgi:tRNA(Arg) A34 adenosine deaminase TadA